MAALKKLKIGISVTADGKAKAYEGADGAEASRFLARLAKSETIDAASIHMAGQTTKGEGRGFDRNVSALDAAGPDGVTSAIADAKSWLEEHGGKS